MAYNEHLEDRIRLIMEEKHTGYSTKKMFGGLCYLVDEKMCFGIVKDELMVRIDPEREGYLKEKQGVRDMDFTKRPMKGFLYVSGLGIDNTDDLEFWIDECLAFNPRAKASRKKKK